MAKVGDTVRYLNAVGGGKIVRIEGQVAYVDEDGFETPVLLKECVVVDSPKAFVPPTYKMPASKAKEEEPVKKTPSVAPKPQMPEPEPPYVETPEGEKLNLVLAFEASDLKHLSSTTYDAYLVNDSNYYLYFSYMTRGDSDRGWTMRKAGIIEPGIQLLVDEIEPADLPQYDRIAMQWIAFKKDKPFEMKAPGNFERKLDTTKFFKLHCFQDNPYFDAPVIALTIVRDDQAPRAIEIDAKEIQRAINEKARAEKPASSKPTKQPKKDEPLVVDLHIDELVDTTAGMSPADMLNLQIDKFREIMDANLRNHGKKIVFIHGKGEGVLRQALLKELNYRYKGCDVQDASFREYGFGATQVKIK